MSSVWYFSRIYFYQIIVVKRKFTIICKTIKTKNYYYSFFFKMSNYLCSHVWWKNLFCRLHKYSLFPTKRVWCNVLIANGVLFRENHLFNYIIILLKICSITLLLNKTNGLLISTKKTNCVLFQYKYTKRFVNGNWFIVVISIIRRFDFHRQKVLSKFFWFFECLIITTVLICWE